MSSVNKLIVLLLIYTLLHQVQCRRGRTRSRFKDTYQPENNITTTINHHDSKNQDDTEFAHKLENAPIPAVHNGPQVLKSQKGPDSIVQNNRSENMEHERVRRHISLSNSPNPLKPDRWKETHQKINESGDDVIVSTHFHRPGHPVEKSSNYPTNTYNYYNTLKIYGSTYKYDSNQPFKGYVQTANIGVIPPRYVNAKSYYNNISDLSDFPTIKQHSNELLQPLYDSQKYLNFSYGYGYGSRDSVKNAYRNVLTGLVMWSIMNGLTNGRRYKIYNYESLPQNHSTEITVSNDTIVPCFEDASALCHDHAQPLCIINGTTFCVSAAVVPCRDEALGNTCVNISVPCDSCEDNQSRYLPCAVNITILTGILDKKLFNETNIPDSDTNKNVVLCATTIIIPQFENLNQAPCDESSCLEVTTAKKLESIVETTTDSDEWEK